MTESVRDRDRQTDRQTDRQRGEREREAVGVWLEGGGERWGEGGGTNMKCQTWKDVADVRAKETIKSCLIHS